MKNRIITGIFYTVMGLLVALGPSFLFPVCQGLKEDGTFMKCHWTAQSEIGIGFVILMLGISLLVSKYEKQRIGISIALALQSLIVILIPNVLIGVCTKIDMNCRALTLPILNIIGIAGCIGAIINLIYLIKTKKESTNE